VDPDSLYFLYPDPAIQVNLRIQGFGDQKLEKIQSFYIKTCHLLIPRPP
jgi:hypothetical protein